MNDSTSMKQFLSLDNLLDDQILGPLTNDMQMVPLPTARKDIQKLFDTYKADETSQKPPEGNNGLRLRI
ncbi:unnamed protein product [Callosobruchus maculatus]|uniref:Uncharacterized protein n=1 Tax=Callosobruchus maculatus TaxID=64391 RepID=A0A653D7B0_CALMS|nr:unnamed protein product [Callosobruchus maculatus]